jgi:DNA-binding transcriptional LysR family regulator
MLNSSALQIFIVVARQLHFGRSAEILGIAQSAVSRQIKSLEHELGVRLLDRGRRSVISLTASGSALLAGGVDAINQLERAENAARRAARGEVGRIEIGYVVSAALNGTLSQSLEMLRTRRPDVEVGVNQMETPKQLAALQDGSIDVGFLRPRDVYPEGISALIVHRESMLLAVASSHPLARRQVDLKALSKETFIIPQFDENAGFAEHLAALASTGGFEPKRVHRVRDFVTAISMAAAGYGVVPSPRSMVAITLGNVVYKRIHGYDGIVELAAAFRAKALSPVARGFIDRLSHPQRHNTDRKPTTKPAA